MIGYGNSMFLATHGILARSASGGAVDPDAQAFITAASITDPTQQSAINQLVVDLKGYGVWTKMKALYPFVGGTSTTHKYNLVNPLDTDAAFRLVFSGGWTHSSNGILGNGVNSWADTFVVLNTLTRDSNSTGIYIRTNVSEDKTDYGMFDTGANGSLHLGARILANLIGLRNGSNQADSISNTDSRGFFQMTRRNSSNYVVAKNTTKSTITRTATDAFGNANKIPLGCLEFGGKFFFSSKQFALFYIGNTSLSDTELDNMNTAVQAFQTTLGRQV
jgi:hypothetical protein